MWSLRNRLFTLCIALSCVSSAAGVIRVYGYERGQVQVSCPYGSGYESYEKYLCKDPCGYDEVLIRTTEPDKNKYSKHDDHQQRVFTATIYNLTFADTGKYWCGITKTGTDIFTEVELEVVRDSCCDESNKVQSYEDSSVSISCPYEPPHQDSLKYICRGKQPSTCLNGAIITSNHKQTGQLRLTDDKMLRIFTVTMTGLNQSQSGSYLCGVNGSTGLDVFSAFELEVKEWCCVRSTKQSGVVGQTVTMMCPYPPNHQNNRKFLCKGERRKECTDMTSQRRFTLREDISSSSFSVTITELKGEEAGTYWCGSDSQWSPGDYTKIQLSAVIPKRTSTWIPTTVTKLEPTSPQAQVIPGKPFEASSLSGVFIALPVLLTLTIVITSVIVCKYKCFKVQGAGADMNRNKTKADEVVEAIEENVYRRKDSASPRQPPPGQLYDDAGENEQESVYQNYASTEDIYCNQNYIRALQDEHSL
ncbi:polymeric immunoglobulin receptor-like isoform X2 [Gasterosteus aculeatus]